jgi:hypothetical protein
VAAIAVALLELGWVIAQRRRDPSDRVARFASLARRT